VVSSRQQINAMQLLIALSCFATSAEKKGIQLANISSHQLDE
jgi:hypothetical protein